MRVRRPDGGAAGSTQELLYREIRCRADEAGIFPVPRRPHPARRRGDRQAIYAEEVTLTITA